MTQTISSKGDNIVNLNPLGANQTELTLSDGTNILFSYRTPVAAHKMGAFWKTEKKWSMTTTRHINKWLSGTIPVIMPQEFFDNLIKEVK